MAQCQGRLEVGVIHYRFGTKCLGRRGQGAAERPAHSSLAHAVAGECALVHGVSLRRARTQRIRPAFFKFHYGGPGCAP